MIIFRKALKSDVPTILELQKRNLLHNLPPQDRQDGFLSIEYSTAQLEWLAGEIGIFVATENDHLAGYLIAQPMDFAMQSPLIDTMVNRFSDVIFRARPLSGVRTFIYGPVCIEKGSRGTGVLRGLFNVMLRTLKDRFDTGVAFVSVRNPRSLRAHQDKLGMKVVDEFDFNGQKYHTLAFDMHREKDVSP